MADYAAQLKKDLLEQFKGAPNIEALMDAVGEQLQAVADFYEQLRTERGVAASVGKQLDGVGDIVVLSRGEAGKMAAYAGQKDTFNDEVYRKYLYYKIVKNTNTCTYPALIKAFRLFWDKPLYYREDPEQPAVMLLDTGTLSPEDHAENLLSAPIIKAAGVGIHITAVTESPVAEESLYVTPCRYETRMISVLPELRPVTEHRCAVYAVPYLGSGMAVTRLPPLEPERGALPGRLCVDAAATTISETRLPVLERPDNENEEEML